MKKIFTLLTFAIILFSSKTIAQINTACNAEFSFKVTGTTVQFTPASNIDSQLIHHSWVFGDGSAAQNVYAPSHTYSAAGKYTVTQYVEKISTAGVLVCSDTIQEVVSITANPPCSIIAAYTFARDTLHSNIVHFTNLSKANNTIGYVRWYFGDSTYSTDYSPTHTFTKSGLYHVCLLVKPDSLSTCSDDTCMNIQVQVPLTCNLQAYFYDTANTSQPTEIRFTNKTGNLATADSSYWSFGDGTSSHDKNISHTYTPGTYSVCLTVTRVTVPGTVPCTSTYCRMITIQPVCTIQPAYTWKVDSLNPLKVDFTNTTFPSALAVPAIWFFGDDSSSTLWSPSHVYAKPGKYYVCLRLQPDSNCIKYQCDTIIIPTPVTCNIQSYFYDKADSLQPAEIHFTNETLNLSTKDSFYWSFGDGTSSRDINPTHLYKPGTYSVCLTVTMVTTAGTAPCTSTFCRTITIQPACNLKAGFTYSRDSLAPNFYTYHFTNTSTPPTGFDSSFWSFGDNTTASHDINPTHAFAQPGTYTICLYIKRSTASGTATCVADTCETIVVPTVCNIKAAYTWKIDSLNHNTVHFTNTTLLTSTAGVSAKWFFGDNSPLDSTWNATHTYTQAGKYYVCLRIQTAANCLSYQCDSITVPQPAATCGQFSLFTSATALTNSQYYTFAPAYPQTNIQYTWTFGDNDGSQQAFASHHFAKSGIYTVCLTAYRDSNCATTTCKEISVKPQINCDSIHISYNYYKNGSEPNKIYFYPTFNYPVSGIWWSITALASTTATPVILTQRNPTYIFSDTGYYEVCLMVVTTDGCKKEYCNNIHIESVATPCELQAYPNPVNNQVNINVLLTAPELIHAFVYNAQSMLLAETETQGNTGNNIVTINTGTLPAGFYTVKLIYGNNTCFARFQKM